MPSSSAYTRNTAILIYIARAAPHISYASALHKSRHAHESLTISGDYWLRVYREPRHFSGTSRCSVIRATSSTHYRHAGRISFHYDFVLILTDVRVIDTNIVLSYFRPSEIARWHINFIDFIHINFISRSFDFETGNTKIQALTHQISGLSFHAAASYTPLSIHEFLSILNWRDLLEYHKRATLHRISELR
jgi:hypothetical protein